MLLVLINVFSLTKTYAKHAKRLRATGEGVNENSDTQQSEETLSFYISGEGPCVETPQYARNIWGMSFFSQFLLSLTGLVFQWCPGR